ncbi:MAG: DNA polymerase I [Acidobacteria bacterium]|nr:DNA polymerase I [Acidobacteriota bacterium]
MTVYLVDGTYTVFRSFFAIQQRLVTADGTPTSGVYGFLNTVRKIVREREPGYLGIAFDVGEKTYRDDLFAEYKANRQGPPPELEPQFPLAMEACGVLGWPVLVAPGFEADDVIATLARQAEAEGLQVVIVTSDKDLYQLVGESVVVLNPAKEDRILDAAGVEEVFGVRPDQVVDVLALMGDAIDNVPGVPGVGEKTAKTLVRRYGTLDRVLERAHSFAELWEARAEAVAGLDGGDPPRVLDALARLARAGEALACLEEQLGGDEVADLVPRFRNAARLAAQGRAAPERALRKALKDLESRTQPKAWLALAGHEREARLSQELVTVRVDAPLQLELERMRPGRADIPAAVALFKRLEFRGLAEEMEQLAGSQPRLVDGLALEVLDGPAALAAAAERLRAATPLALDVVTDAAAARLCGLVGIALCSGAAGGSYVPLGHRTGEPQVAWDHAREPLAALLGDAKIPKVGHGLKFDRTVLRCAGGIELEGIAFDTLLAWQLLDPGRASQRLDELASRYLGQRTAQEQDITGRGGEAKTLDLVDVRTTAGFAVENAVVAGRLVDVLRDELRRRDLLELFENVEMPLLPVLERMEARGIRIDTQILARMSAQMERQLGELESEIHRLAGHPFAINSPVQLRKVLFDELDLKPSRRTQKTRVHSTGQEVLEALADVHPLPALVLEYRELSKLKGTYVDALPKLVDPRTGRVHTQFHQLGAATGRLSSEGPNLQNIPIRTVEGRRIREGFVPEPGWQFLSADYSQMELRVLAHLADDPSLQEAFQREIDIHRFTAALVSGIPLEEVTPAMRAKAKAVNFGIIYGMSEFRLAREQELTREEARAFIAAYFERYPRVRDYIDSVTESVQRTGEVRTLFNRARYFPELTIGGDLRPGPARMAREALLRQAVNATVQGTAADIVKMAMIEIDRRLGRAALRSRLLLQVHDELLFEGPPEEIGDLGGLVRTTMEQVVRLSVPLKVEIGVGQSWAEVH